MSGQQSKTPWTPGPWAPCRLALGQRVFWVVISKDGRLPETEGNANVQAAAPEMAELLAKLLPMAEDYLKAAPSHPDNAVLEDVRALLARIGAA